MLHEVASVLFRHGPGISEGHDGFELLVSTAGQMFHRHGFLDREEVVECQRTQMGSLWGLETVFDAFWDYMTSPRDHYGLGPCPTELAAEISKATVTFKD